MANFYDGLPEQAYFERLADCQEKVKGIPEVQVILKELERVYKEKKEGLLDCENLEELQQVKNECRQIENNIREFDPEYTL
jgi:hypothetical protein